MLKGAARVAENHNALLRGAADCLAKAADRESPTETKRRLITDARDREAVAIDKIGALVAALD